MDESDETDRNRELVKKVFGELADGRFEAAQEVLGPRLRDGGRRSVELTRSVFPDLTVTLEDLIAEGDKVVARWTARGTHKGEATDPRIGRVRPTGKSIAVTGITILLIRGGEVVDTWGVTDELTGAGQLGILRKVS